MREHRSADLTQNAGVCLCLHAKRTAGAVLFPLRNIF